MIVTSIQKHTSILLTCVSPLVTPIIEEFLVLLVLEPLNKYQYESSLPSGEGDFL